jgi:hypothetical protein
MRFLQASFLVVALASCDSVLGEKPVENTDPSGPGTSGAGGRANPGTAGNSGVGGIQAGSGGMASSGVGGSVAGSGGTSAMCSGAETNLVPLRRLTRGEFERTVNDVFAVSASALSARWPASLDGYPFATFAAANPSEEGDLEQMILAVEAVTLSMADRLPLCAAPDEVGCARTWLEARAKRILRQAPYDTWADCAAEGAQCTFTGTLEVRFGTGTQFVNRTATGSTACTTTAFGSDPAPNAVKRCSVRRPAINTEIERLVGVYTSARRTLDARESLAASVESMLLNPEFVYLVESRETGAQWQLSANEQARRLTYAMTGRSPTDATLTSTAAIGTQAQSIASSTEGREQLRRFLAELLGVDGFRSTSHSAAVANALDVEFTWLLDRAVAAPNLLEALFTSRLAWVNSDLETFYGLPRVSTGPANYRQVELAVGQRAGLMTHPLIMTKLGHGNEAATILRGNLLLSRVLCIDLPAPPANAGSLEPQLSPGATSRQKYAARIQNTTCAGCHVMLDPLGFALDGFDGLGRYLPTVPTNGDTSAFTSDLGTTFASLNDLGTKLANSRTVSQCLANQWYRFAMGRKEGADCATTRLHERFAAGGFSLSSLVTALPTQSTFTTRHAEEVRQ